MQYNDCHVHFQGGESLREVIAALDAAQIDRVGALSPNPVADGDRQLDNVEGFSRLIREAPDRLIGFCWLNPTLPNTADLAERAITELGYTGIKLIPHHWHPYDEDLVPFWERLSELQVPCIIHTGILWGYEDSSRFCRPVDFEVLIRYPGIRFALAHIGWPWTDECIAVAGRFAAEDISRAEISSQEHAPKPSSNGKRRMYVDITLGAPRPYRRDALSKALAVVGDGGLLYGSDCSTPELVDAYQSHLDIDRNLLSGEIGLGGESISRIMHDNFDAFCRG